MVDEMLEEELNRGSDEEDAEGDESTKSRPGKVDNLGWG
jgi:hypothetical protein